MQKLRTLLWVCFLLSWHSDLFSQFSGPVATTFRPANKHYYICNHYSKTIVALDPANNKTTFISGLTSPNNILYAGLPLGEGFIVLDSNEVKGYDTSGTFLASFSTAGAKTLQDAVFDDVSGALYISDVERGVIYKTTFGPPPFYFPTTVHLTSPHRRPSAMVLQRSKNRILYVEDTLNSRLMAVNLTTGDTSAIRDLGLDNCVGLAEDGQGNLYISSQGAKAFYQLNKYYTGTPKKLVTEPKPGDLFVNIADDKWVYTCILCGTVFISPIHGFGPGPEMELCPESTFAGYRNGFIKNIGTYEPGNSFIMELSSSAGSFANPTFLGSVSDTLLPDSIVGKLPAKGPSGNGYLFRWRSTKPAITGFFERMTILPRPKAQVATTDTVQGCIGSKIQLGYSTSDTSLKFSWWPVSAVDSPANSKVQHTVDTAMKIYLYVWQINGCNNNDSAWIKPVSKPDPGKFADTVRTCLGSAATLGATPNGDLSYHWSPGMLLDDSTLAQPKYSGNQNQTFTLWLTAPGGCQKAFQQSVAIDQLPAFTLDHDSIALCFSKTLFNTITTKTSNYTCAWVGPGSMDSTIGDSRIFYWNNPGKVRVVFTDNTTGCKLEKTVVNDSLPRIFPKVVNVANKLSISEDLDMIQWYKNDTLYTTDSLQITASSTGKYKACGISKYGCDVCTNVETVTIVPNSVFHTKELDCSIFPIPANDFIQWNCNANNLPKAWILFDLNGRTMQQGHGASTDISSLQNGIYFLRLENSGTFKIVKTDL